MRQMLATVRTAKNSNPRVAVIGVGHEQRGDDAVGLITARHLRGCETILVIEGGSAPENVTGAVRAFSPNVVLFIDAAQLDLEAGAVRWLDAEAVSGLSASTHTLPLRLVAQYLQAMTGCEVALIGIQPAQNALDAPLSPVVADAASQVAAAVQSALCGG